MSGLPATVITGGTFASPNDVAMHRTEPFKERFWVFKTYFNYKEKIGASKIRDNTKKYSKYDLQCLPAITWNKKIFLTQVAAITYTLEQKPFAVTIYERLGVISSWIEEKALQYYWII